MSEEKKKLNVFELFKQSAQTYEESLAKRESEKINKKIDRYRVTEEGKHNVRILPLCPRIGEDGLAMPMERKGYEYAVRQQFITIKLPSKKGGKQKKIQIPVVQATQPGVNLPVDIIDTYVKIAKEYGDDEVTKKVTSSGFEGGLKWNYQHAIYVLDLDKNRKGPLLWMCSGAQYHAIEEEKQDVWDELRDADADNREQDPVASFDAAYPLTITRTDGKKVEYKFKLKTMGKPDSLSEEELNALINMPRIDDEIYKYTRYQFEATLEALKQYDEMLEIDVCAQEDFIADVEKLRAALPKEDTSHFDLSSASDKKEDGGKKDVVTIDTLWSESDANDDNGFTKGSDEYNELREKILQFIQDNKLDVRVSHSKTNAQLLEDVEDAMNNNIKTSDKEESSDDEPEVENAKSTEVAADDNEPAKVEKPAEEPKTRRRRRPTDEPSNNDTAPADKPEEEQKDEAPAEEAPAEEGVRRRRRR